jgi:hypothetical protein
MTDTHLLPARRQGGRRRLGAVVLGLLLSLWGTLSARAEGPAVGTQLQDTEIRDARDEPTRIPDFGKKVLMLFYTDPNVADQNDEFGDKVKALELDRSRYASIGIANMKDAPGLPNWIIRIIIRKKIKRYNVTILTDPELILAKAWNLGVCDDKSVVLILDHKGVLQYTYRGALPDSEQQKAMELLKALIAKAKAESPTPPAPAAPPPAN